MLRIGNLLKNFRVIGSFKKSLHSLSALKHVDINEEVMEALKCQKPVVALESTIITHGMPYPENIQCSIDVENTVRQQGGVPATVAILKGRIKVGIDGNELSELGDVRTSVPIKTSRRDFSYVVSAKLNGGTTVSGTLIIANQIGIPVFATGGIGGVHREGETSFDVSADLIELGKSSVAVISSGVKSILDIAKTLEYLETQGVFVATYGDSKDFPAFYCRKSGCESPYNVTSAVEAANIIKYNKELNLKSGMLFAAPVPAEFAMDENQLECVINEALENARRNGVTGKQITPYLLAYVAKITGGRSLDTNMALVKNNAKIAADIAVELARIESGDDNGGGFGSSDAVECNFVAANRREGNKNPPVIIGGSVLDCCAKLSETEIMLDGRMHDGNFSTSAGGVARNICEALGKLGRDSLFLSAVGDDAHGHYLLSLLSDECSKSVRTLPQHSTAQCIVIFNGKGECKFLIGDMAIHEQITAEFITNYEDRIKTCPLIVLDGNPNLSAIENVLKIANTNNIPVLFEPTDVIISSKPFETSQWKAIKIITPNLTELKHIANHMGINEIKETNRIALAARLAKQVVEYIPVVIVTLGSDGLIVATKGLATDILLTKHITDKVFIRHYPAKTIEKLTNVSGAGDCFVAGLINSILDGYPEQNCITKGLEAAYSSLVSSSAVPLRFFNHNINPAQFQTINI